MHNLFANTKIILIKTTHPGNIGSSARAMATMGFSQLTLINPLKFPHKNADEMAVGAKVILDNVEICEDFPSAVKDCVFVLGLTARCRDNMPVVSTPNVSAKEWVKYARSGKTAFVFGTESAGLENEVLYQCHRLVTIPVNPDFSSLNLASAVQLMCYEARMAALGDNIPPEFIHAIEHPTTADIESLITHFEKIMGKINYLQSHRKLSINERLKVMFHRLTFERQDIRLLRGFLKEVEKNLSPPL